MKKTTELIALVIMLFLATIALILIGKHVHNREELTKQGAWEYCKAHDMEHPRFVDGYCYQLKITHD